MATQSSGRPDASNVTAHSWVEISRSALQHNIHTLKKALPRTTALLFVVKANAYGHGVIPCARVGVAAGADWLGVVALEEAFAIRDARIRSPILTLSYPSVMTAPAHVRRAAREHISISIASVPTARAFSKALAGGRTTLAIHVKIDTGLGRLGLLPNEAVATLRTIARLPHLRMEGIWTHFAKKTDQRLSDRQRETLQGILDSAALHPRPLIHAAASAAALNDPAAAHLDLVRCGIATYGIWPTPTMRQQIEQRGITLRPVLQWRARVLDVRTLPAGTPVGYDHTYRFSKRSRVAILAVGYADGYDRRNSNRGIVLLHGRKAPVRGRVAMDLTLVDVSMIPNVRPGDTATLLGTDRAAQWTADDVARVTETIPYEVVTRINWTLPRLLVP